MENRHSVDQRRAGILRFLREQSVLLARQGTLVASWRRRGDRRLGPYYRLAFRESGRQRSLYLGNDPELIEKVRQELECLRAPRQQRRQFREQRKLLRRELVRCRAAWNEELSALDLHLQGSEIRGWRRVPPGKQK